MELEKELGKNQFWKRFKPKHRDIMGIEAVFTFFVDGIWVISDKRCLGCRSIWLSDEIG